LLYFYTKMYTNPQKQDIREVTAACLVRKGVVPAGYTGTDYQRDRSADPKPEWFESADALSCYADPTHA
jgi:hypothetical protein